jgi:tetratricopeptide (TPR) repeat protein
MPIEDTVNVGPLVRSHPPTTHKASPAEPSRAAREPDSPAPDVPPTHVIGFAPDTAAVAQAAVPRVPGYDVEREIARGGMGIVLAARDPRLGRDVAIKVLLPGPRPGDAAARFVQESKITARLPHPAIPPVYELGTLPDGDPFLAMKLVRGRTLAAELAGPDRTADLPRFVQAFEQVAQAVGFAHAQRVIHRDLKPANVMVGAFGEVQVMDWGIAKEVGEPGGPAVTDPARPRGVGVRPGGYDAVRTETGLALGTPAYMAPEQARGERLGPPADVFALGGVLCFILTGHPPFGADTVSDTLTQAARGDVAAAFGRLDACTGDAELVALCKRLLSPRAADRPADGKAVADAVAAYRAGLERRARDADRERAAAAARAAEQRKKRRAQVALDAAVVALVGLVGLGAWWQDRQAADRRLDEERRHQADRARLARNAAAVDDLLAEGEGRLRQGDADRAEEVLGRADERFADGGSDDADGRRARLRAELAALRAVDRAHDLEWAVVEGERPNRGREVAAWGEAFRRLGVAAGSPPSDEAVSRVRDAAARDHLLGGLERWFWLEPSAGLAALLRSADPDEYRNAVRGAVRGGNAARLGELAGAAEALAQPVWFALALARAPAVPAVRRDQILQALHERQPNQFRVLMDLAAVRPDERPERTAERVGWYRAAVAVRPRSVAAWYNLGAALHRLSRLPAAIEAVRVAIRLDPKFAAAHYNLANALQDVGDLPGAVAAFKEAVRLDPGSARAHANLANALCAAGDPRGAVAASEEAVRLDPTDARSRSDLGNALRAAGDLDGAIGAYQAAIRQDPKYALAHSNLGTALYEKGDVAGAVAGYREAIRLAPGFAPTHSYLGNALREAGDPRGAIAACRESIRLDPNQAHAHSNLGLALKAGGSLPEAVAAYKEAIRLDPTFVPAHNGLGLALRAAGDPAGAVAACREAIRLAPRSAAAHNGLGLALRAAGDPAGAVAAYKEAIRTDPKYTPAYNNLGILLKASGDLSGAVAAYKEAIRLDPKDALANYNLGLALTAAGDAPGAVAAYRRAVRINPDFLLAHGNLAPLLRASGDLPGAVAACREVVRLNPRHAAAHAALGLDLSDAGDLEAGRAAVAEAARLDPKQFAPLLRQRFAVPAAPAPREVK